MSKEFYDQINRSVTAVIKVAYQEGGEWHYLRIHSLEMPDGSQWDAVNGWRTHSGPINR